MPAFVQSLSSHPISLELRVVLLGTDDELAPREEDAVSAGQQPDQGQALRTLEGHLLNAAVVMRSRHSPLSLKNHSLL